MADHVARVLDFDRMVVASNLMRPLAMELQEKTREQSVKSLLDKTLDDSARRRAMLPTSLGGLGIRPTAHAD